MSASGRMRLAIWSPLPPSPSGIADYVANPVKKREDFPAMPPQAHLSPEHRLAVAKYMLQVKN